MPAAKPDGTTIQKIQSSLRFNYALLDRRPRAPRKDPDPKERARLQNRIAELRADLHRAQEAAPAPQPAAPARRPRTAARPDPTELFPAFAQAEADEHEHRRAVQRAHQDARRGAETYSVICSRKCPPESEKFSVDEVVASKLPLAEARALSNRLDGEIRAAAGHHYSSWTADLHFIQLEPPAVHPWDTGGRGPAGSAKAGVPVLWCPHCRVTFYLRPGRSRCPSCSRFA